MYQLGACVLGGGMFTTKLNMVALLPKFLKHQQYTPENWHGTQKNVGLEDDCLCFVSSDFQVPFFFVSISPENIDNTSIYKPWPWRQVGLLTDKGQFFV